MGNILPIIRKIEIEMKCISTNPDHLLDDFRMLYKF